MTQPRRIDPARFDPLNPDKCEQCGSAGLVAHERGKVCPDCGLVCEAPVLASCLPYDERKIQNAIGRGTTLGTRGERWHSERSRQLDALQRLQAIQDSRSAVETRARREAGRIFEALGLPPAYKEIALARFRKFRSALKPGTKFRSAEKLVPLTIFFSLRLANLPINEKALLEVSKISKKEFNAFRLQITRFLPEYARRNRLEHVLRRIFEVSEHFGLGMDFYYRSKALLYEFRSFLASTTDGAMAGVACSLCLLCYRRDRTDLSVNQICRKLGVRMSTVQSRVKRIVDERYEKVKFEGLVKSAGALAVAIGPILSQ